jgi:hypothetical protein
MTFYVYFRTLLTDAISIKNSSNLIQVVKTTLSEIHIVSYLNILSIWSLKYDIWVNIEQYQRKSYDKGKKEGFMMIIIVMIIIICTEKMIEAIWNDHNRYV